jgi:hypothetical protein
LMRKMNSEGDRLAGFESPDSGVINGLMERERERERDREREGVRTPERSQSSEHSLHLAKSEQPAKGNGIQGRVEKDSTPVQTAPTVAGSGAGQPSEAAPSYGESPSVLPFFSSLLSFTASATVSSSPSSSSSSSTIDFNNMTESPYNTSSGGSSRGELDGATGGYFSRGAFADRSSNWAMDSPEYSLSLGGVAAGQRSCKLNPDILLMDPSDDIGAGPRSEGTVREDTSYLTTANEITDSYNNGNMKDGTNNSSYSMSSSEDSTGNIAEKARAVSPASAAHTQNFKKHAVCNLLKERVFTHLGSAPSPFTLTPVASRAEVRVEAEVEVKVEVEDESSERDICFKPVAVKISQGEESNRGRDRQTERQTDRQKETGLARGMERGREEGTADRYYSGQLFREQYKRSVRLLGLVSCCVTPAVSTHCTHRHLSHYSLFKHFFSIQYNTVQCSAVQCSTVHHSTVHHSTV